MDYLFQDPRPEIIQDTNLWMKLFRLIPTLEDKHKSCILHKRLWTLRSAGTMLKPSENGLKFVPLVGKGNDWDSENEFEDMKKQFLKPFANEISDLLRKVMEP